MKPRGFTFCPRRTDVASVMSTLTSQGVYLLPKSSILMVSALVGGRQFLVVDDVLGYVRTLISRGCFHQRAVFTAHELSTTTVPTIDDREYT